MKRILIVDDMGAIRSVIRTVLKSIGDFQIDEAVNGEDGLSKIRMLRPDVVISDWNMPKMSGLEMLTAIRGDQTIKTIPVIMLTAEGTKSNVQEAASAGVNGYILKPFTPDKLETALTTILKKLATI